MKGAVNEFQEPILPITILSPEGEPFELDVIVDTGSTSELTLPAELIEVFQLDFVQEQPTTLADGQVIHTRVFHAQILWHSSFRRVRVIELKMDPLIGMRLLEGSLLFVHARAGGEVLVEPDGTTT